METAASPTAPFWLFLLFAPHTASCHTGQRQTNASIFYYVRPAALLYVGEKIFLYLTHGLIGGLHHREPHTR